MQAYQKGTVVFVIAFATVMGLATTSAAQVPPDEFRTLDGMLNNVHNPTWGSAGIQLLRISRADYADGVSEPAGMTRKSPREISNILAAQLESILNHGGASDFIWQWGQFLDHDLDLTTEATPKEPLPISVPGGDPFFVPNLTGNQTLRFNRSIYDPDTGTSDQNPRQQLNLITSFIDASNVYGLAASPRTICPALLWVRRSMPSWWTSSRDCAMGTVSGSRTTSSSPGLN